MGEPIPFTVDVPAEVLDDLTGRLARTRWPGTPAAPGWRDGADHGFLRGLVSRWRELDWRARERELNRHPQFRVDVDGTTVHFLHIRRGGFPCC